MTTKSEDLESALLEWLQTEANLAGDGNVRVDLDTDLMEDSVLDSLGFMELLEFVEDITGHHIEIEEIGVESLTTVRSLSCHIRAAVPVSAERDSSTVIEAYSESAGAYDQDANLDSCWGKLATRFLSEIQLKDRYRSVVDVGCGAGHALRELATRALTANHRDGTQFTGIEPAENMRLRAASNLAELDRVRVVDGRFEALPLDAAAVDYVVSIMAFHWVMDLQASANELARVLGPDGEMDLFFTGRDTGQEFRANTTPVLLEYMGPRDLLESTGMRQHLTLPATMALFEEAFPGRPVKVDESRETHYDSLEGHWAWWVSRASGHFAKIPAERRQQCDTEVRDAIASLATPRGIPYTVHVLHVQLRSDAR